jgi:surface protein
MTKYLVKNKEELQEIIKTNSKPLNSLDVSNITDMSFLFSDFSNVTYFDIDSWDTSNVSSMYRMFEGCSSLTTLPLLDTSSVSNMYRLFEGCSSLTTIPLFDTSNVTSMGSMFYNCSSLPLVDKVLFLDKSNNDFKRQIYLQMSKEQLQQTYNNLIV